MLPHVRSEPCKLGALALANHLHALQEGPDQSIYKCHTLHVLHMASPSLGLPVVVQAQRLLNLGH